MSPVGITVTTLRDEGGSMAYEGDCFEAAATSDDAMACISTI